MHFNTTTLHRWFIRIVLTVSIITAGTNTTVAAPSDIYKLVGENDAVWAASPDGRVLLSKHADKKLIPASILKLLTALVALHYLGEHYRFKTDFYMDPDGNITVKGYGDPMLISEELRRIAHLLAARLEKDNISARHMLLDDSYFDHPLTIPGISASTEPYDAPNGALCANFNTVAVKRDKNGNYISAESQTPLLPFIIKEISPSQPRGRLVLSHHHSVITKYPGLLLAYFLGEAGKPLQGEVRLSSSSSGAATLYYRHVSSFALTEIIAKLMAHSNNFIANQLLIAAGAVAFAPPGNLTKGIQAAMTYSRNTLAEHHLTIVEGSGISRQNRVSAKAMGTLLERFAPYHRLLRRNGREYYKTGTLKGIRTRAGYIKANKGALYRYVVMINTPGRRIAPIMKQLMKTLK